MPQYNNKFHLIKCIVDFPLSEPEYHFVGIYVRHNSSSPSYQHLLRLQTRLHKLITSKVCTAQLSHSRHAFLAQEWFNTEEGGRS